MICKKCGMELEEWRRSVENGILEIRYRCPLCACEGDEFVEQIEIS